MGEKYLMLNLKMQRNITFLLTLTFASCAYITSDKSSSESYSDQENLRDFINDANAKYSGNYYTPIKVYEEVESSNKNSLRSGLSLEKKKQASIKNYFSNSYYRKNGKQGKQEILPFEFENDISPFKSI